MNLRKTPIRRTEISMSPTSWGQQLTLVDFQIQYTDSTEDTEDSYINLTRHEARNLATALIDDCVHFDGPGDFDILYLESERMKWSRETFPEATAESSLLKLEEEIKEIRGSFGDPDNLVVEYADAMMCLFDSAGRSNIKPSQILIAFKKKLKINKERKWSKNTDNTYSHIKNPFASFGRKPHVMDFDNDQEFEERLWNYDKWESENSKPIGGE